MSLTKAKSNMIIHGTDTVEGFINTLRLNDYVALRLYGGVQTSVYITRSDIAGNFVRDDSDTTSVDNGGTVIVSTNGKRWKRAYQGEIHAKWFQFSGDGSDESSRFSSMLLSLAGSEGTGYGAPPVTINLSSLNITFSGTVYVPVNIGFSNGTLTSAGKIVYRNPAIAAGASRTYTEYWPWMTSSNRNVTYNCLVIVNCYIGLKFNSCRFTGTNSALVLVNSNGLWTEYTQFDGCCTFLSNSTVGAAILFDGNSAGTSIYSTGSGAGTSDGSFGYTMFSTVCKIDVSGSASGIKVISGGTLYNSSLKFYGYIRTASTSSFLNIVGAAVNQCNFEIKLESFGQASNVLNISNLSNFWYNTGSIVSASPEMVMVQGTTSDLRSNDIVVVGVALQDSNGVNVFNGSGYSTKLVNHVSKRVWTKPAFSAYLSSNQTINSNSISKVNLDTEDYDTASCFSSGRFTPNVAGYYQINAQAHLSATGSAAAGTLFLYKNGVEYRKNTGGFIGTNMVRNLNTSVYMNGTTDYLELFAYVFDNSAQPSITSGKSETFMDGCLLREA
jgi:hypothetical protein